MILNTRIDRFVSQCVFTQVCTVIYTYARGTWEICLIFLSVVFVRNAGISRSKSVFLCGRCPFQLHRASFARKVCLEGAWNV